PVLGAAERLDIRDQRGEFVGIIHDPRERWHHGTLDEVARIPEVRAMPLCVVLAADPRKIRTRALGAEHMRCVIHELVRSRNGRIHALPARALGVREQGTSLLCMAVPATFANIDGTALELEFGVRPELASRTLARIIVFERLGPTLVDERRNYGGEHATDEEEDQGGNHEANRALICFA